MSDTPKWLVDMPKTNLHIHMAGSTRLSTLWELAMENGVDIGASSEEQLRNLVVFKNRPNRSLEEYIKAIQVCESVFKKPDDFRRVCYEIAEDAHAENVRVLELRFAPTNYRTDTMTINDIVKSALKGLAEATDAFGMYTGLIICGMRTNTPAVREAAELAVKYQDRGVVGFDLAGIENGYRPRALVAATEAVRHNFMPITVHAGEDDTVASIAEAILYLNAKRIGHGRTLLESTKLVDYLNKTRLGIEVCMTSNLDTGVVASYQSHPVEEFHRKNLRISINTDNSTVSDTTVTREYMHLIDELRFTQQDIYRLAMHGIKSAFIDVEITRQLLEEFNQYATGNGHTRLPY